MKRVPNVVITKIGKAKDAINSALNHNMPEHIKAELFVILRRVTNLSRTMLQNNETREELNSGELPECMKRKERQCR